MQVYDALKEIGSNPFPYALVSVLLAASVLLYAASRLIFGRHAYAMQGKAPLRRGGDARPTGWRLLPVLLPFLMVIALALLPHAGVILTSFSEPGSWYRTVLPTAYTGENYLEALGHSMTVSSIRNSLFFASLSVLFDLFLGIAIAFVVVRSTIKVRGLLDALAMIPLAVPGLVMAFGFLPSARCSATSRPWPRIRSGSR